MTRGVISSVTSRPPVCRMFVKEPKHLSGTTQCLFLHSVFSDRMNCDVI
jgi:hypothetical protein